MNLQEQGMLLHQAEFMVYYRRKKCVRRVFLFEEVIMFSKTVRSSSGNDTYIYRSSIKVCKLCCELTSKTETAVCIVIICVFGPCICENYHRWAMQVFDFLTDILTWSYCYARLVYFVWRWLQDCIFSVYTLWAIKKRSTFIFNNNFDKSRKF